MRTTLPSILLATVGEGEDQTTERETDGNALVNLKQSELIHGVCVHPSPSSHCILNMIALQEDNAQPTDVDQSSIIEVVDPIEEATLPCVQDPSTALVEVDDGRRATNPLLAEVEVRCILKVSRYAVCFSLKRFHRRLFQSRFLSTSR